MPIGTPSLTTKKKLYYDLTVASSGVGVILFCASTGIGAGASDSDRYGNVMQPNRFNGVTSNAASIQRRCKQAITAVFEVAGFTAPAANRQQRSVVLDFIKASGNITTQDGIDPTTQLRPRLRVRMLPQGASGTIFRGTIYIQKQHSIEV